MAGGCPDHLESLVGLGALTPLQVWAEGHPQTPSTGASGCQEQGLAAALAKEQGRGTKKAAGALQCSGRLPGGLACAKFPRVGGLGSSQDLRSRMFRRWWQRSRRRADGGRTAPGVHHDPPHGCQAPMDSGWVGSVPRSEELGVQMSPGATAPRWVAGQLGPASHRDGGCGAPLSSRASVPEGLPEIQSCTPS